MAAQNIDEVITRLEVIIEDCIRTKNRAGYFAALYHKVTCRVKEGISNNEFEDGPRMERLDVLFANRYIAAWDEWTDKRKPTSSWQVAFESTKRSTVLVLQHLLLGMNAHINLDLGIAAVETAAGKDLDSLQKDFNSINMILASLTYEVVGNINRVSPLMSLMGFHATNYNAILIQFTMSNARDGAWCFAEDLVEKKGDEYAACIVQRDSTIMKLAEGLTRPRGPLKITLWIIHFFEWRNPAKIIQMLSSYKKKYFTINAVGSSI